MLNAAILTYFIGFVFLMGRVAAACTHANCRHGWYSKYTGPEKAAVVIWLVAYPYVAYYARKLLRRLNGAEARDRDAARGRSVLYWRKQSREDFRAWAWGVRRANSRGKTVREWQCLSCAKTYPAGATYWFHAEHAGQTSSRSKYCGTCREYARASI
ncbi:MAG: hypothetical protein JWM95_2411 [Gemmatimonadetes bacterium]|nr:hypothetical protein [Gemmatimonadota bacterium]